MLQIPSEIQDLYKSGRGVRNVRITFPNDPKGDFPDINNDQIVYESLSLTEGLCSSGSFKYGYAERSELSFEVVGYRNNFTNHEIEVYLELDLTPFPMIRHLAGRYVSDSNNCDQENFDDYVRNVYTIPLGRFLVNSCKRSGKFLDHRSVTAYSKSIGDETAISDVAKWRLSQKHKNEKLHLYVPQFIDGCIKRANWKDDYEGSNATFISNPFTISGQITQWSSSDPKNRYFIGQMTTDDRRSYVDFYIMPASDIRFFKQPTLNYQTICSYSKSGSSGPSQSWTISIRDGDYKTPTVYSLEKRFTDDEFVSWLATVLFRAADDYNKWGHTLTNHGGWDPYDYFVNGRINDLRQRFLEVYNRLLTCGIAYSKNVYKGFYYDDRLDFPVDVYDDGLNSTGYFIIPQRYLLVMVDENSTIDSGDWMDGVANIYHTTVEASGAPIQVKEWKLKPLYDLFNRDDPSRETDLYGMTLTIGNGAKDEETSSTYKYTFYDSFSTKDLIESYLEIHGMFGNQERNGDFSFVRLPNIDTGPFDDSVTYYYSNYSDLWYDEFEVEPIGYILYDFVFDEDETQTIYRIPPKLSGAPEYEVGNSVYDMTGNVIFKYLNKTKKIVEETIRQCFVMHMHSIRFIPVEATAIGLPYVEDGDISDFRINSYSSNYISTYILKRTMSGIQNLEDSITSDSGEIISGEEYEEQLPDE